MVFPPQGNTCWGPSKWEHRPEGLLHLWTETRGVKTHPKNSYKIESLQDGHMLGGGGLLPDGSTIDPMHLLLAPFQMASSPELQNGYGS